MTPQFRFTLYHPTIAPTGIVLNQPLGWKSAMISLERDKEFHSLVEYFKGTFIWYGTAMTLLQQAKLKDTIRILIEVTFGSGFITLFDGTIDKSQEEVMSKGATEYKMTAPIIREGFWSKFMARKSIPVDLMSTTDLDGGTRTAIDKIVLPLPGQVLNLVSQFRQLVDPPIGIGETQTGTDAFDSYVQLGLDTEFDEIPETYTLPLQMFATVTEITSLIEVDTDGDLRIDITGIINVSGNTTPSTNVSNAQVTVYYKINDEAIVSIQSQSVNPAADSFDEDLTYADTVTITGIVRGDRVRIFLRLQVGTDSSCDINASVIPTTFTVRVRQASVFPDTETDAFLIKDAAESIISKLVGADDVIVSDLFDQTLGHRLNAIAKGKHFRGNSFTDKAFFMSFMDWWTGAAPMLGLGLGYDTVADVSKIRIEQIEYFYDPSPIVFLNGVSDLVRTNDLDKFFKSVETGFSKWSAESESGFDDPQTKAVRRADFGSIGIDLKILSTWIAASLAIEQTRRNRREAGKDWRLDEDYLVVAVKPDGVDYTPELGSDFDTIVNLLNSDTRINVRHTPARIFKRWQKWLQGGAVLEEVDSFKFTKGEGNYEMQSTFPAGDYESEDTIAEDDDISVGTDYILIPRLYKGSSPMKISTYQTMIANRHKALGISRTNTDHLPMHIIDFNYGLVSGKAEFLLILASNQTVDASGIFDATFDGTFE